MKKNIDLIVNGVKPEKVMYDTDNHSLVVLYPAQREFKKGDVLAYEDILLIFDEYANKERNKLHSLWNNIGMSNKNWITNYFKHATDEQKAQLHKELRKEGKKWNKETLEIEDINPEFKRGDILASDNKTLLIFDKYATYNKEKDMLRSLWNNAGISNINWQTKVFVHATDEQIAQLHEDLREEGKKWNAETLQVEDLDISDIVVDLETACEYLKKPIPQLNQSYFMNADADKFIAQITLQLIREAWNKFDGFEVDWDDSSQGKHYPMLRSDGSIMRRYALKMPAHISGYCYSFATPKRALQFGTQFKELLKTAMGL